VKKNQALLLALSICALAFVRLHFRFQDGGILTVAICVHAIAISIFVTRLPSNKNAIPVANMLAISSSILTIAATYTKSSMLGMVGISLSGLFAAWLLFLLFGKKP